jgi:hypothetical protein
MCDDFNLDKSNAPRHLHLHTSIIAHQRRFRVNLKQKVEEIGVGADVKAGKCGVTLYEYECGHSTRHIAWNTLWRTRSEIQFPLSATLLMLLVGGAFLALRRRVLRRGDCDGYQGNNYYYSTRDMAWNILL